MKKIKVLALFGESGSGKDSIQSWLAQKDKNVHKLISYTTRPPRQNEQEGKDYFFVTESKFLEMLKDGKILEYTVFNDWYYGTSIDALKIDKINVGVFNPDGIRNLLRFSDELDVLPVWIQTDEKNRLLRTLKREIDPDCHEICRRFLADENDFKNINFRYEYYANKENCTFEGFLKRPKIFAFFKDNI